MLVKKVPSTTHLRFLFVGDEFYMGGGGPFDYISRGSIIYIYLVDIILVFINQFVFKLF